MKSVGRGGQGEDEVPKFAGSYSSVWTLTCPDTGLTTEVANPDPEGVKDGLIDFDCTCGHRHRITLPWRSEERRKAP